MSNDIKKEERERYVTIQFEGYQVDLFLCESGSLGLTVELVEGLKYGDENPCRDIFINKKLDVAVDSCILHDMPTD